MDLSAVRRWWPLAGVVALLAAAALAAAHSSPRISRADRPLWDVLEQGDTLPDTRQPPLPDQPADPAAAANQFELPGWLVTAAFTLCVAAVAVMVGLLLYVSIRNVLNRLTPGRMPDTGRGKTAPEQTAEEVAAALDAGLADLSAADADPRRAVIACWVRLEQAAAAAGTPRQIGDTPTDLVSRLLHAHHVSADVLAAFAGVYREARYATRTVDERMRGQARAALQRLRDELGTGTVAGMDREVAQ
ncbi:MAG TPA: DUF4129 domain-containing protein [Micromonosporaceae bacterium]|nr:DUF4129 domain-containing protein [Micromonosporaceae bacterium]